MTIQVLDISMYQPTVDWQQVKASGIDAVYVKATEGVTITDSTLISHVQGARSVGIPVGVYHFAHPENNSAADEAKHFMSVVEPLGQLDLLPVLDLEEPTKTGMLTAEQIVAWVQEWDKAIEAYCSCGILYTYLSYLKTYDLSALTKHPLWIADYAATAPSVSPWSKWTMWQKSDSTTVKGITGNVDISEAVSLEALKEVQGMYPSVPAQLNGKSVLAVAVNNVTYLIWTVAKTVGANLTKTNFGDVEIDGKKPPQVVQDGNTYIEWSSIPGLTAHKLSGGGFNFTTKPAAPATHNYTMVVTEPAVATAGDWATLTIQTLDNGQPLGHQVITISENGVEADHDYTDATTGSYVWQITETTNKTDTMAISWTDPAGKTHTIDKSTVFSVPQTTAAPIPPDDTAVAVIPAQITNDQVLLDAQTTGGKTLHMQLDTGAQTVTLTAADAATLGLTDPGGSADISVQGITGSSKAYIATITLVLGGVTFANIEAVVDADFQGPSLLGYDTFAGQYDLLVSQKHNSVTVLK